MAAVLGLAASGACAQGQEMPTPREASEAFRRVEGWVRALEVEAPDEGARGFHGASVTLRLGGAILGRGSVIDEPSGRGLPRATELAIAEAVDRLPIDRDALWKERAAGLAEQIVVELELAGRLVPLEGETDGDRVLEVRPGLDGVAARLGERSHGMYPGFMLSTGTLPDAALGACRVALTGRATEAVEPDRSAGAVYYRFEVVQMTQLRPGGAGVFLHRGGRVAEPISGVGDLRGFAGELAAHLLGRVREVEGGGVALAGTLDPLRGVFEPEVGSDREQAVGALALARFGRSSGGSETLRARALGVARGLLRGVAERRSEGPEEAVSAATWVVAADAAGLESGSYGAACARLVREAYAGGAWREDLPGGARALLVHAMSVLSSSESERARAREALTSVYKGIALGELVSYMPWLGWAELELSAGEAEVRAGTALREMRRMVWVHQLTSSDVAPWDRDFVGGIVFSASRSALPSWQGLRPLTFVATMLGDERLTPAEERGGEIARLMHSLRFARQLAAGEEEAHMYRDRSVALGGVRASLWDQRMPPIATSLGLLAATETLESLDGTASATEGR